jgi:uncharacterized membrane protein YfcA
MPTEQLPFITISVVVIAFLYSSVAHGGASGYITVMSLFGITPALIKPTALILNISVACIGSWQFWRMGFLSWKLFWSLVTLSIPMSFLGGYLNLPATIFKTILGVTLLLSAIRFLVKPIEDTVSTEPILPIVLSVGGVIGLLSGLTGTGGGIFLTPILLWMRWASAKTASAVSAMFILVNSISGLLGNLSATRQVSPFAAILLVAAVLGGIIGSYLGSHKLSHDVIQQLLSMVLIIAGLKIMLT